MALCYHQKPHGIEVRQLIYLSEIYALTKIKLHFLCVHTCQKYKSPNSEAFDNVSLANAPVINLLPVKS